MSPVSRFRTNEHFIKNMSYFLLHWVKKCPNDYGISCSNKKSVESIHSLTNEDPIRNMKNMERQIEIIPTTPSEIVGIWISTKI